MRWEILCVRLMVVIDIGKLECSDIPDSIIGGGSTVDTQTCQHHVVQIPPLYVVCPRVTLSLCYY